MVGMACNSPDLNIDYVVSGEQKLGRRTVNWENLEEKVVEAEPSRQEEPKPSEKATKDAGSVDRAKPSPEVSLPEPQGKGCACDVSSSKHRAPLWCWLVIAFLFGAVQRRRMSR